MSGPFLLIEAARTVRRDRNVAEEGTRRSISEEVRETVYELVPPKTLEVENRLGTERRCRWTCSRRPILPCPGCSPR